MSDIEIARRLIERVGGADAAFRKLQEAWGIKTKMMRRYENHSSKYLFFWEELRHQLENS